MNKRMKKLTVALLVVLVFVQLGAVAVFADEGEQTYAIRIFAGSGGATVNGKNVDVIYKHYNEPINLADYITPGIGGTTNGGRYYVKCIRESGKDNNEVIPSTRFNVKEDADYVIGYGITGNLVSCRVDYIERSTGEKLFESQYYYGNVGDKPIISYVYIDGYQPQAYNLTKTLSANEADNVFTFLYTPIVQPTAVPAPTSAPSGGSTGGGTGTGGSTSTGTGGGASGGTGLGGTVVGGGSTGGTPATAQPAGGTAATAQPGAPAAPAEQNGAEATAAPDAEQPAEATEQPAEETAEPTEVPTEELEEEQTPLDEGPKDLIDLDEEETPLGEAPQMPQKEKSELQKDREQKQTKFYIAVALLAASLTGIVVAVVLVIKKSRAEQR